jgi:hypothetical protein
MSKASFPAADVSASPAVTEDDLREYRRCLEIFADNPDKVLTWGDLDSVVVASAVRVCGFLRRAGAAIARRFS